MNVIHCHQVPLSWSYVLNERVLQLRDSLYPALLPFSFRSMTMIWMVPDTSPGQIHRFGISHLSWIDGLHLFVMCFVSSFGDIYDLCWYHIIFSDQCLVFC